MQFCADRRNSSPAGSRRGPGSRGAGLVVAALCLVVGAAARTDAAPGGELTPQVRAQTEGATVLIQMRGPGLEGSGSGFVAGAADGALLVVTNAHVAAPSECLPGSVALTVVFYPGSRAEQSTRGELLWHDDERDLALVRVRGVERPPRPLDLTVEELPQSTQTVYVYGYPFGEELATHHGNPVATVSTKTVSAVRRDDGGQAYRIQLDGDLNPGNSGGPVTDAAGHLVGVVASGILNSGISFIIPTQHVTAVIAAAARKRKAAAEPKDDGRVRRERTEPVVLRYGALPPQGRAYVVKVRESQSLTTAGGAQHAVLAEGSLDLLLLPVPRKADGQAIEARVTRYFMDAQTEAKRTGIVVPIPVLQICAGFDGRSRTLVENDRVRLYRDGALVSDTAAPQAFLRVAAELVREHVPMFGSRAELTQSPCGRAAFQRATPGGFFDYGLDPTRLALLGVVLADTAVAAGDTWTADYAITRAGAATIVDGRVAGRATYTVKPEGYPQAPGWVLLGISARAVADRPVQVQFGLKELQGKLQVTAFETTVTGEAVFDRSAGQVVSVRLTTVSKQTMRVAQESVSVSQRTETVVNLKNP